MGRSCRTVTPPLNPLFSSVLPSPIMNRSWRLVRFAKGAKLVTGWAENSSSVRLVRLARGARLVRAPWKYWSPSAAPDLNSRSCRLSMPDKGDRSLSPLL